MEATMFPPPGMANLPLIPGPEPSRAQLPLTLEGTGSNSSKTKADGRGELFPPAQGGKRLEIGPCHRIWTRISNPEKPGDDPHGGCLGPEPEAFPGLGPLPPLPHLF
ncbi:unnamed protein product [Eretmochelys imbricata]